MSFIIVPIIVNIKIYPARYLDIDILTIIKLLFFSRSDSQDMWDVYNIQFLCARYYFKARPIINSNPNDILFSDRRASCRERV